MAFAKDANGLSLYFRKLQSRFSDPSSKNQRKPYIIPTSFGLVFGSIVLVFLIFALGYSNNVIYIFVFLMISTSLTSMYVANRNLEFVRFKNAFCGDVFANQSNPVRITIENTSAKPRYDFKVLIREGKTVAAEKDLPDIPAMNEKLIELLWSPKQRGWQALPRFQIESQYPFGMLKAWRNYLSTDKILVFPEKKGNLVFPSTKHSQKNSGQDGLFRDLREYSKGDQVRRIDWRASTKHQDVLVKIFENEDSQSFEFTWNDTSHINSFEDRISQLALWIDTCERQQVNYSVEIGLQFLKLSKGPQHFRNCMKLLAELEPKDTK